MKQTEILQKVDQIRSDFDESRRIRESHLLNFKSEYSRLRKEFSTLSKELKVLNSDDDPKLVTLYGEERLQYLQGRPERITELADQLNAKKFEINATEHLVREMENSTYELYQEFKDEINKIIHSFNQKLHQSVQAARKQFAPTMSQFYQDEVEILEKEYGEIIALRPELESCEADLRSVQLKISEVKRGIKNADQNGQFVEKATIEELAGYLRIHDTVEKKIGELHSSYNKSRLNRIKNKIERTRNKVKDPLSCCYTFREGELEIFKQLIDADFTKDGSDGHETISDLLVNIYKQEFSDSCWVNPRKRPRFEDFAILGSHSQPI